jgi:parallel beta-helix repeat protein
MSKLICSRKIGGVVRTVLSLMIAMSVCAMVALPAHALNCGDAITADVTLTADLGPCTGNGISVDGIPAHVTVNLNGHTLRGTGNGGGITLGAAFPGVTIKGPGKIANFATGVSAGGAATDLMIYDVTFIGNPQAISLNGASSANIRILNNTIQSGGRGQTAINASNEGNVYIYQNVITGFSVAAISILGQTTMTADENFISQNQAGIVSDTFLTCTVIRGNNVTLNRANGIQMGVDPTAQKHARAELVSTSSCNDIEDNTVTSNGNNGIFVQGGDYSPIVQNNIVSGNQGNGISIVGAGASGTMQVLGNRVSNSSGMDLLWDSNGNTCWTQNIFTTSSPATLPPPCS